MFMLNCNIKINCKVPKRVLGVALALLCVCSMQLASVYAEGLRFVNVTGTVTNENGEPLAGVTVSIKGTETSTATDDAGIFRLNLPMGTETLIISYVGYRTQEIAVDGRTTLDVVLQMDEGSLDEVIVTGYGGVTTKGVTTGAIDAIKGEEIEDLPLGNLSAALTGRILGADISGGTSRPGSAAQLTIRNPLSLSKNPTISPLYIIDDVIQVTSQGFPDNSLFNSLDPSEIESITILKDASAAIYGSRAANGAVIVTTKRGKTGAPRISYSGSAGVNDESYRTKMLSAYEMAQYVNIVNGPYGENRDFETQYFFSDDELEHLKNVNYDWLESNWKPSLNMRHTLNVSGGAEKATYFANISYYTQDGNIGKLDHNKWTMRAGADVNVFAGFKAGLQVSGSFQDISKINNELGGESGESDYQNLLRAPRYIPRYIDGLPVRMPGSGRAAYHFNEIERTDNYIENDDRVSSVNLYAEYEVPFLEGLKFRASYARNMGTGISNRIGGRYYLYEFGRDGRTGTNNNLWDGATNPTQVEVENDNRIRKRSISSLNTQFNFSANYSRQFGLHGVSAYFGVERSEAESNDFEVLKEDPIMGSNGELNTAFGEVDGRGFAYQSGTLGYIGRANYNYSEKYLIDFLFRSDASTKFAPENYWGKFYSLGAGWVISKEDFFKSNAIDFLKVRYSIGRLGKDDMGMWLWRQRYTYENGKGAVFGNNAPASTGIKMQASPNRDATWSDELKHNFGVDARFLDSRLSTTLEGFYNKGTNMLIELTAAVPITVGGSIASQNYAAVDFFGYEIGLGWHDDIGSDFSYGIDTRFTWYDNRVHKGNFNDADLLYPWNRRPGESSDNGTWGYDYLGMFKTQADIDNYVQQYNITEVDGIPVEDLKPGMLYYRDVRGSLQPDGSFAGPDGIIDDNDRVQLAKKSSSHYGFGITLRAAYKGFSLDAVIAGSFGGWSEIDGRSKMESNIDNLYQNVPAYWNDIYDPDLNPDGKYPNPNFDHNTWLSDFWKVSSFRMRMRNINLNYALPQRVANSMRVRNARLVLTCINPMNFFNPYDYRDSEGGWDVYPVIRTVSLGVNVTL